MEYDIFFAFRYSKILNEYTFKIKFQTTNDKSK